MTAIMFTKSQDRVFAGVCGGVAEYLGCQPWQVRAVFTLVSLVGGAGVIAYGILCVVMPPSGSVSRGDFHLE